MAERLLPTLIPVLDKHATPDMLPSLKLLKEWNKENSAHSVATSIFETWTGELKKWIWKDEFPESDNMLYPLDDRTAELLTKQPTSKWFDNVTTKDTVETLDFVVVGSFKAALDSLTKHHGPRSDKTWAWYKVKNTSINHLVPSFKVFSRQTVENGGGSQIVNATTTKTGPSWRMVVELDKEWPRAYGLYPSGQSGKPASKYYDNMIDDWTEGKLNTLIFMKSKDEKVEKVLKNVLINPKK